MITVSEFARKVSLGDERVRQFCKTGRIKGAKKFGSGKGGVWLIPKDASVEKRLSGRPRKAIEHDYSDERLVASLVRAEMLSDEQRLEECQRFMNSSAKRSGVLFYEPGCWSFASLAEKNDFDSNRLAQHIAKTTLQRESL